MKISKGLRHQSVKEVDQPPNLAISGYEESAFRPCEIKINMFVRGIILHNYFSLALYFILNLPPTSDCLLLEASSDLSRQPFVLVLAGLFKRISGVLLKDTAEQGVLRLR